MPFKKRTAIVDLPSPRGKMPLIVKAYKRHDGEVAVVATAPDLTSRDAVANVSDGSTRPVEGWNECSARDVVEEVIVKRLADRGYAVNPATADEIFDAVLYVVDAVVPVAEE